MYLEVVTYEDSRVELTPEVVRTCRYYVYTYEVSCVELTPEVVRTCRYYLCTVWFSLSWRHTAFCLSWFLTTSFVTVFMLCAVGMCKCMCRCMCSVRVTVPGQVQLLVQYIAHLGFLSTIVHMGSLLWACAYAGAGAWASACACAGAGVCLLQRSLRCLSAIIHVCTAFFSPHRFFESYKFMVFCTFFFFPPFFPELEFWSLLRVYYSVSWFPFLGYTKCTGWFDWEPILFPCTATTRLAYWD